MSDAAEALAPTANNFDAIVAAKTAALEAKSTPADDAPDTQEYEGEVVDDESHPEEVDGEPEEAAEDESEGEDDDEEPEEQEDNDPLKQPVEAKLAAPFKAFREALKTKRVTPELLSAIGDLELEVETVNGPAKLRLSEMGGHVMREARFSREMAKTKEVQANADRIIQIEQQRTNAWRNNVNELEHGLKIMGCGPALEALHQKWAHETYNFLQLPPHEQQRIQQERAWQQQQEHMQIQKAQLEREILQLRQQSQQQQFDEPTRQAGDYITKNMDSVLGAALKKANAGKVTNPVRQDLINELTALCQQGVPLEAAMKEAAETVADRYAERREIAQAQNRANERKKPEVSGRRAPAGGAPPKRDNDGRFRAPTRSSSNGSSRRKGPPTAESFGERFGV